MVRPVPAGRRGSCCTPYSRLQEEIDNVETIAVTANNTANNAAQTAQQALTRDTFDDVNVNGDLNVYGDIIQQGAAYETHAQHVFSTDDYIVMRDGALVGLAVGDYSGFQVKKYDGTNDGRLVIDRDGTARVGDVGDEQPLLTRDESADMTNAAPLVWDAANSKAVTGVFPVSDPGVASINGIAPDADNDFTIEAGNNITITSGINKITIAAAGSSGTWTERAANNDWTDIFQPNANGSITSLKDIIIIGGTPNNPPGAMAVYIPKGITSSTSGLTLPWVGIKKTYNENSMTYTQSAYITAGDVTHTYISTRGKKTTFTIDFATETFQMAESNLSTTLSKSNLTIYTKD